MIIRIIKVFIFLLLSVWLGVQLYQDPGYLLISINRWTIESTLGVVIPILIVSFLIVHELLLLLNWVTHLPRACHDWLAKRRMRNAQEKTNKRLIEFSEVKDWPQLIALLPALKHHKIISEPAFNQFQKNAWLQQMTDLIQQKQNDALTDLIQHLPKNLANDPVLIAEYSRYLLLNHEDARAEALLRRCLKKQFNEELIILYGQMKSDASGLSFAKKLLKTNPHSAGLHLSLGRICRTNRLWGQAKTYLEESIKLRPSPAAYAELGELLEQLDDHAGACEAYRQGLITATTHPCV